MAKKSRRKQSRKKKNSSPEMAVSILVASPAEERNKKYGGGSMLNPPERKAYAEGGGWTDSIGEFIYRKLGRGFAKKVAEMKKEQSESVRQQFNRAFRSAREAGESEFIFEGKPFHTRTVEEMATKEAGIDKVGAELMEGKSRREIGQPPPDPPVQGIRKPRQAGGSMMVPPEMEMEATAAPVDTYPNIPPEEMAEVEASQLPDEEMEEGYIEFIMNEALDEEEQSYLMNTLEADPQLSMIFDKVVETASEFSGSGEVEGPGTGVSDSIPARLSDGEFVVTKKATDQLGADNLQSLMDEAERAFDGGLMSRDSGIEDEEIRKSMVASNQMPSLNVRQR